MTVQVLTKETGIANWITPTGRKLSLFPWIANPSLLEVKWTNEKGEPIGGALPESLQGKFTSSRSAEPFVKLYVTEFWNEAEKQSNKKL